MNAVPKILFYAINGIGMGHLTRLYAIARQLARLLRAVGRPSDIRFLTTSEAPGLVQEFPVYKLPSEVILPPHLAKQAGCDNKFVITSLMASFRPDMLVLDTMPGGCFNEVAFVSEFVRYMVFVDRHREQSGETGERHRKLLSIYDLVLVPDRPEREADYGLPPNFSGRRSFIGPVTLFEAGLDPALLRAHFGWPADARVAYVSAGGGGDAHAQATMKFLAEAMVERGFHVLAGYGPLYRGSKLYHPQIVPLSDPNLSALFGGVDLAISAAGYNSYQELLAARVPTLFYAQPRNADRQDRRVAMGLAQNWHGELSELSPAALDTGLAWLAQHRDSVLQALASRQPALGSLRGAYEILNGYISVHGEALDRQFLAFATLALRHASGDQRSFEQALGLQYSCWYHANGQQNAVRLLDQLEKPASEMPELYADLAAGLLALFKRFSSELPQLEKQIQRLMVSGLKQPEPARRQWQERMQAWLARWSAQGQAGELRSWLESAPADDWDAFFSHPSR